MQVLALLLASVAVAMASKAMIAKDFKEGEVLDLCKSDGEFLLHPTNRCKYIRCTFGDEPWKGENDEYKFYPLVQDCPYGTAVSRAFYGHSYGYGSEGQELRESTLCAERVHRTHGYGNSYKSGYDQCNVERPHGYSHDNYAHTGYANTGYGHQGYGNQGYAHQGYAHQGYAHQGYAPQGYAHQPYAHQPYAHQGYPSGAGVH